MENKNENKKASVFSVSNIIYACVIVLALAAAIVIAVMGRDVPKEIADENGAEDHSLAVLTDKDICAENPLFYCETYGVSIDESTGIYKITAEAGSPLSGVSVLEKSVCRDEKVTFTVECTHSDGNIRIVLLDENMRVLHDFAAEGASSFTLENALGKSYEIRIAGESARFTVNAEITAE